MTISIKKVVNVLTTFRLININNIAYLIISLVIIILLLYENDEIKTICSSMELKGETETIHYILYTLSTSYYYIT